MKAKSFQMSSHQRHIMPGYPTTGDKFDHVVKVVTIGLSIVKRDLIPYLPITLHPVVLASVDDSCLNQLLHLGLQNDNFLILSFLLHLLSSILLLSKLFLHSPFIFLLSIIMNSKICFNLIYCNNPLPSFFFKLSNFWFKLSQVGLPWWHSG